MDRNKYFAIWQNAAYTTDQLSAPRCWTRAIPKSPYLHEKYWRISWGKKVERKTHRAMGVGGRTWEEKVGWNSNDSPEVLNRGEMSDIPGLPLGWESTLTVTNRPEYNTILYNTTLYNTSHPACQKTQGNNKNTGNPPRGKKRKKKDWDKAKEGNSPASHHHCMFKADGWRGTRCTRSSECI